MNPVTCTDLDPVDEMFAHEFFDLARSDARVGTLCDVIGTLVDCLGGINQAPDSVRSAIRQALAANDVLAVQQIQWFPIPQGDQK